MEYLNLIKIQCNREMFLYFFCMTSFDFFIFHVLKLTAKKTKVPLFYRKCIYFFKKGGFFVLMLILFCDNSLLLMSISNLKTYLSTSNFLLCYVHSSLDTEVCYRSGETVRSCYEYLIWCEKYFI